MRKKVIGERYLRFLYETSFGKNRLLPLVAKNRFLSSFYSYLQKWPGSNKKIVDFCKKYEIDISEFEDQIDTFASFNDFFTRRLKKSVRPVDSRENIAVLPADGRYLAFEDVSQLSGIFVKGQTLSLEALLKDRRLAEKYKTGSLVMARLAPVDYHRFHFPDDAVFSKPRLIKGDLFSVNPIALRQRIEYYLENKRWLIELKTHHFGLLLFIVIGATNVGSVVWTAEEGKHYSKGEEMGYFEFGGSSIALLFEPKQIDLDPDIIAHTKREMEVKANFGTSMGIKH